MSIFIFNLRLAKQNYAVPVFNSFTRLLKNRLDLILPALPSPGISTELIIKEFTMPPKHFRFVTLL